MRILVADDDAVMRVLLTGVLEKAGHEVILAQDGVEALDVLSGPQPPQLAVLDWIMPKLEGSDVIRRVRERQTDRPPYLIMLTSRDRKEDVAAALDAGANDYLTKPFNAVELLARIAAGGRMIELQNALSAKIAELREAMEQIKTLRGIVPICAYCKKIRDDTGYWQQVEQYVHDHTEADFSHGICPACLERANNELETFANKAPADNQQSNRSGDR